MLSKNKVLEVVHKKPIDESAFTATLRSGAVYNILNLEEHKGVSSLKAINGEIFTFWTCRKL